MGDGRRRLRRIRKNMFGNAKVVVHGNHEDGFPSSLADPCQENAGEQYARDIGVRCRGVVLSPRTVPLMSGDVCTG